MDQLTKAELRIDDMGRRALGLVDPKQVDITSGGLPLGAFNGALDEIRKMMNGGNSKEVTIDVETLAGKDLEEGD